MTISKDTLREVELLLREALAKLGPDVAFRQKVLLQMALFEVEQNLSPRCPTEAEPPDRCDEPGDRPA